jgi:AcrR family transcriptional regulator
MSRSRTIPDLAIFQAIRRLLTRGGDKAVSFSAVARATGLAGATLVQRYGTRERMVQAALLAAWDALDAETDAAILATADKSPQALLKALSAEPSEEGDLSLLAIDMRDAALRARATTWRARVEAALTLRMGEGDRGREAAAMLFAAWQGQMLWEQAGGRGFRLKDAARRLA